MAVFKPTNCSPYLTAFDITYLDEGPIYFQCKIDTSNTKIDGYAITIYDNDNNQVFPFNGNTIDNMSYIEDLRKDTIRIDSPIKTNGISDLNTGLNGTYLKIPFVVKQSDFSSFAETTKNNMVYYDSSNKIIKDKSGNTIELTNGSQYKWSISLYQLGENAVKANENRPEDDKYYDMTVANGKILGSTNERIQSYPSDQIYNDYFIQLCKADIVHIDSSFQISKKITGNVDQIGTRVRIKDYDSYLGHMYLQNGQDGMLQSDVDLANVFQIFKMSNSPDDLRTTDKVDFCITKGLFIPKYFHPSPSDSSAAYLKQIFYVQPTGTTDNDKIESVKSVYNKPFAFTKKITQEGHTVYGNTVGDVLSSSTPTVNFNSSRVVLNTETDTDDITENDGYITNNNIPTSITSTSSNYNGIWIPQTPTIDTKSEISGYYKVTIQWYRSSDANTWGKITNKIVLDTNLSDDYDGFCGKNIQAYPPAQEGQQVTTGAINITPLKFDLEEAVEIYPNNPNESNYGLIYKNNMDVTSQLASSTTISTNNLKYEYLYRNTWRVTGTAKERPVSEGGGYNDWMRDPIYIIKFEDDILQDKHTYQIFAYRSSKNSYLQVEVKFVQNSSKQQTRLYYSGKYGSDVLEMQNINNIWREKWKTCEIRVVYKPDGTPESLEVDDVISFYIYDITTGVINFISPSTAISIGDKIFDKDNSSSKIMSLDKTVWAIGQAYKSSYEYENKSVIFYPMVRFSVGDPYSIKTFFRSSSENQFNLYSRPIVTIKLESASGGASPQPEPEINPKRYLVNERSIVVIANYQQNNLIQWRNYQWFLYNGDYSGENKDLNSSDIILQSQVGYDKEIKYTFYGLAEDNHDYTIVLVLTDQYGTIITVKQLIRTNFNNGQGIDIVREDEWANYGLRCDLTAVDIWFTDKAGYIFPNLQDRNYLYTENNYANNPYGVTYDIQNSVMNIGDDSDGVLYDCVYGNLGTSSYNAPSKHDLEFDEEKGISFKTQMQINTKQYDAEFLNVIIDGSDNFSSKTLSVKIADFYIPQDQWPDGIIGGFPNQNSAFIQKIQNGVANKTLIGLPNSAGKPYGRSRSTTDLWPSSYGIKQSDIYNYLPINIIPFWINVPNVSARNTWFFIDYSSNGMKTLISENPIKAHFDSTGFIDNDIDLIYEFPIYTKGRNPIYSGGKNPYVLGNFIDGARTYSIWQDTNEKIIVSTTFNIVISNNEVQSFYANRLANNAPKFIKDNIWNDTYIDSDGIEHDYYWDDGNDPEFTDLINIRNDDKTLITRRNSLNGKVCTFDVNYQGGDTDIDVTMTMGDTMDETPKEGS